MCAPWSVCTAVRVQCGLPLLVCCTDMTPTHAVLVVCSLCMWVCLHKFLLGPFSAQCMGVLCVCCVHKLCAVCVQALVDKAALGAGTQCTHTLST